MRDESRPDKESNVETSKRQIILMLPDNHTLTELVHMPLFFAPKQDHMPLFAPKGRNMSAQGRAKRLISREAPPWVSSPTHTQP